MVCLLWLHQTLKMLFVKSFTHIFAVRSKPGFCLRMPDNQFCLVSPRKILAHQVEPWHDISLYEIWAVWVHCLIPFIGENGITFKTTLSELCSVHDVEFWCAYRSIPSTVSLCQNKTLRRPNHVWNIFICKEWPFRQCFVHGDVMFTFIIRGSKLSSDNPHKIARVGCARVLWCARLNKHSTQIIWVDNYSLGKTLARREEDSLCRIYFDNNPCHASFGELGEAASLLVSWQ